MKKIACENWLRFLNLSWKPQLFGKGRKETKYEEFTLNGDEKEDNFAALVLVQTPTNGFPTFFWYPTEELNHNIMQ